MDGDEKRAAGEPGIFVAPCDAPTLFRVSRGFACVFWGMPCMAAAHALALSGAASARATVALQAASFLPALCGIVRLRLAGRLTAAWDRRAGGAALAWAATAGLAPFAAWWMVAPGQSFLAANAALHLAALTGLLCALIGLAGEAGRWMGDDGLRREAVAGKGMALWLVGCTVAALAWLFRRSGILDAGLETVLASLARLPREARVLFLLPYAMAAYVAWRAKETGFRRAIHDARPGR
jgi:hypothetical protein